ncbi:aldo/keto reductase [Streptomyces brasiliensis]|uniref:Aldo/keto reductase n=1 Tax=Streptomyces brasiliensis TaxID=1954 RepID=A0A917ULP7_9ACTN|nr:aldo/keto reductase [Streptomyces brasiliensis]GGJ66707.1 aldo/keto reductase [Streptomyces brasiliensis]
MDQYFLLGRSGLRGSRPALGTMNFGTGGFHAAYGKSEEEARPILHRYLEAGGNFIDTADFCTAGESETMLGDLIAEAKLRDPGAHHQVHLQHRPHGPERRRQRTFDDLTRAGKIRYAGLSDVPGWYAARAQTYADAHALEPLVPLQVPYSPIDRTVEAEHVPMGQNLGLGITAWSPLGGGFLTGKYRRTAKGVAGEGRFSSTPAPSRTEQEWQLLEVLESVAGRLGVTMAQVALNRVATQPGVASAIVGASTPQQLDADLAALDFELPGELRTRLDEASAVTPGRCTRCSPRTTRTS